MQPYPIAYLTSLVLASALCVTPLLAETAASRASSLERPGYYPAQVLAPGVPLRGDQYTIRPQGYDDGLMATFWIDSSTGETYQATGMPQLYQRIAEIYAIAKLRQMDSGKEYANSLGKGASNTVSSVGKTLSDPGSFFKSIPQGASKFFGSLGENLKGGQSQCEAKVYSNVLDQSKAKRLLAFELGVNPTAPTRRCRRSSIASGGRRRAVPSPSHPSGRRRHSRRRRRWLEHEPDVAEHSRQPGPRPAQHGEPQEVRRHRHFR
jgi:hypothetical protein